jgi:hypothetical protein
MSAKLVGEVFERLAHAAGDRKRRPYRRAARERLGVISGKCRGQFDAVSLVRS